MNALKSYILSLPRIIVSYCPDGSIILMNEKSIHLVKVWSRDHTDNECLIPDLIREQCFISAVLHGA